MENFVAIRKETRLADVGQSVLSAREKREQLIEEAQQSHRAEKLERSGFQQVQTSEAYQPLPEDEPAFGRLGYVGAYIVNAPDPEARSKAIQHLQDDYYILPNIELSLPQSPELKEIRSTRKRKDTSWPEASGVRAAQESGATGLGVRIGVLDTGCDADHEQLRDKEIDFLYVNPKRPDRSRTGKRAFDTDTHGTHVCGIIAGQDVGVAPDVELMVAAVIESETHTTNLERIVYALNWMLSKFKDEHDLTVPTIINMSLGFRPQSITNDQQTQLAKGMRAVLATLLMDFDVLPIVSIGNDGPGMMRMPGYFSEALSVGAVDFDLCPASFSGGGRAPESGETKPDIVGFGVNVYSCLERDSRNRNFYGTMSGTSMAAPYTTGIAALYASADKTLQGTRLRQKLIETALKLDFPVERAGGGLARYQKESD